MPHLRKNEIDHIVASFGSIASESRLPALSVGNPARFNDTLRKMLLMTDSFSFCELPRDRSQLRGFLLSAENRNYHVYKSTGTNMYYRIAFASNIAAVVSLLSTMSRFTTDGKASYFSNIIEIQNGDQVPYYVELSERDEAIRSGYWRLGPYFTFPKFAVPKLVDAPFIASPDDDIGVNVRELAPLMELHLPVIEQTTFNDLHRIMGDEPVAFAMFKSFLTSAIESLGASTIGSEHFSRNAARIEKSLKDELVRLKTTMSAGRIRTANNVVGGAIALCTLSLFCLLTDHGDVLKFIGPGGAVFTLSSAFSNYWAERIELKKNPVYFLWLLSKSRG
jgi:hypothetical protein